MELKVRSAFASVDVGILCFETACGASLDLSHVSLQVSQTFLYK